MSATHAAPRTRTSVDGGWTIHGDDGGGGDCAATRPTTRGTPLASRWQGRLGEWWRLRLRLRLRLRQLGCGDGRGFGESSEWWHLQLLVCERGAARAFVIVNAIGNVIETGTAAAFGTVIGTVIVIVIVRRVQQKEHQPTWAWGVRCCAPQWLQEQHGL